jgi:hypothetical protein
VPLVLGLQLNLEGSKMKFYGIEQNGFVKESIVDIASGPRTLDSDESGKIFTNTGASGSITFNLPSAVKGLMFTIAKVVGQDVVVSAATGDYVADSTEGGTITNSDDSDTSAILELRCVSDSKWIAYGSGTWVTA